MTHPITRGTTHCIYLRRHLCFIVCLRYCVSDRAVGDSGPNMVTSLTHFFVQNVAAKDVEAGRLVTPRFLQS